MVNHQQYDVGIVGGGLAGLALSIQSAKAGFTTILFEKEEYPFHKVCGEYVSLESWDFLEELGMPLSEMHLPIIKKLMVTAPNGRKLHHDLPLGGFGISRYTLDAMLADLARRAGVDVRESTKVTNIQFAADSFLIDSPGPQTFCKVALGSFGKRANLDVKWQRSFIQKKPDKLDNYVAVKYHIKTQWPEDLIALHNFRNGYCGISRIEDNKYCLCYLTSAKNLARSSNSISSMEKELLFSNPHLKKIFTESDFLYDEPLTISQISFHSKTRIDNHVLFAGDSAGLITPLCGNGMSMALHGSKIAFQFIRAFLQNDISRNEMEIKYDAAWRREFAGRLRTGRVIQRFFGSTTLSNLLVAGLKPFPSILDSLIAKTHGKSF